MSTAPSKKVLPLSQKVPPKKAKPKLTGAAEMRAVTLAALAKEVEVNLKDVNLHLRRQAEAGLYRALYKTDATIAGDLAIKLREQGFVVETILDENNLTEDEQDDVWEIQEDERALRINWEGN